MVADFVSANYGWHRSPNGNESPHIIFQAGKACKGCLTNEDIVAQAEHTMEILAKYYLDEDHILVYDCASTHLKCSDESLSASKMPKNTSKPDQNFGVIVNLVSKDGKLIYGLMEKS